MTNAIQCANISESLRATAHGRVVELVDSLDSGSSVHCGRAGSSPASRTKKSYHFDTTFFIHYGVMAYHHRTKCGGYHQKERENRSFLHIITLQRVLKFRNCETGGENSRFLFLSLRLRLRRIHLPHQRETRLDDVGIVPYKDTYGVLSKGLGIYRKKG